MAAAAPLFHNCLHNNWDYGVLKIFQDSYWAALAFGDIVAAKDQQSTVLFVHTLHDEDMFRLHLLL